MCSFTNCSKEITGACGVSSVSDIDGNVYGVVRIGDQCWMDANLKTTKYRDGVAIPKVDDGWDWWHLNSGAFCYFDNSQSNGTIYGHLYNWYAVSSNQLCPEGWHVPTSSEWSKLEEYLGGPSIAGGKLKEEGIDHWRDPNEAANNETGFTALPGGYRSSTGGFYAIVYNGYFWLSNEGSDTEYALYRFLDYSLAGVYGTEDYKVNGISVRCIKD